MTPDLETQAARLILFDEGERLQVYRDSFGNATIGVGHNLANGISPAVSALMFSEDRGYVIAALNKSIPWWTGLHANAQMVLLNMGFNLGASGLLSWHNFLHALQFRQYQTAAAALMNSKAARQLPNRYGRLAALLKASK